MNTDHKMVRLTKLEGKNNEEFHIGYWIMGERAQVEPVIGQPYILLPVFDSVTNEGFDYFATSRVIAFNDGILQTKNSKWRVEVLPNSND